jgi:hypothetical protein
VVLQRFGVEDNLLICYCWLSVLDNRDRRRSREVERLCRRSNREDCKKSDRGENDKPFHDSTFHL